MSHLHFTGVPNRGFIILNQPWYLFYGEPQLSLSHTHFRFKANFGNNFIAHNQFRHKTEPTTTTTMTTTHMKSVSKGPN